jgi:hypothetical protein
MPIIKRGASPDEKWEAIREIVRAWRVSPTSEVCFVDRGVLRPCPLPLGHDGECYEFILKGVRSRVLELTREWYSRPAAAFCVRDDLCLRTLGHEGHCWPALGERPRL